MHHSLTVTYRRWKLLHPATSPPQGTILRTPSRPLLYHGSMTTHEGFPAIFGTRNARASLLTLVSSSGRSASGVVPPASSTPLPSFLSRWKFTGRCHASFRSTLAMWAATPTLRPRNPTMHPLCEPLPSPCPPSAPHQPLQHAIDTGAHQVSLALLHTSDHEFWSARLYCEAIAKSHDRPKPQAVLLMRNLRSFWDHQAPKL